MTDRNATLEALEGRTPALFLLAGGIMIVFLVNTYLRTFTGNSYPVVQDVVAPFGFFIGVIGLVGFYSALADRTGTVARVAAALAAVTAVCWTVIIGSSIFIGGEPGGPLAIVPIVTIVAMILSFAMFGVISLRSGTYSPVVGVLLLLESGMFLLVMTPVPGFVIDIGHVLAYLGLGITLWNSGMLAGRGEPAVDSTA